MNSAKPRLWLVCWAASLVVASCGGGSTSDPGTTRSSDLPPATPNPVVEPPPLFDPEGPLQGGAAQIPEIWIAASQVSKGELAAYLKTTVEQLDWVNPGLPDPVPPDTLIAIPAAYRVLQEGESLSSIAGATGHAEELLSAANPKLAAGEELPPGSVVSVPLVYVVAEEMSVDDAAASLGVSGDRLLSANPTLVDEESLQTGTVLVVPPQQE